jgi:hypothetical protein
MAKSLPDLWDGCYDGTARRQMSPEDFRKQFCNNCMNSGCSNSKGAGMGWVQRMSTQEERLLTNPLFADPNEAQFRQIAEMDFRDTLRKALAIEIADRRGDWEVPTDAEIGVAAAELTGMSHPSGFQASSPLEEPPQRLVDEVKIHDKPARETPLPVMTLSADKQSAHLGTAQVVTDRLVPREEPELEGQWKIRGDSKNIYQVTLYKDQTWDCTCPSPENPCKHARSVASKLARAAPAPIPAEEQRAPEQPPPGAPMPFRPQGGDNTQVPGAGVMIGGGSPPPEPDPWAPKSTLSKGERVIPVGGRVKFKK